MNYEQFLSKVYDLSAKGSYDDATDLIFDTIDRLLLDGIFADCDSLLSQVDPDKLDTRLMRSFLSISAAASDKLPSRMALYDRIYNKMIEIRGKEKTDRILKSLQKHAEQKEH